MYLLWVDFSKNKKFNKAKNYEILNIKVGQKHYTSYIFTTWYFSHTGWSRFQTDQSTKQNRHLIQNFNAVFNESFQAFVSTKFPLSLFSTLSCSYLTTAISTSNDFLTFLSQYLFLLERFFGCNQSKWPWHTFECSVASEDD